MSAGQLILMILDIYSAIIIASAIMSRLVAFGVVNVRNQVKETTFGRVARLPRSWSGCLGTLADSMHARACSGGRTGRSGRGIACPEVGRWQLPGACG